MRQFECVSKIGNVIHVGVRDNKAKHVLHLFPEKDEDGKPTGYVDYAVDPDGGEWTCSARYSQVGSDKDVARRWNKLVDDIVEWRRTNTKHPYDAGGEEFGTSCENLVGVVLMGDRTPSWGKVATFLRQFGIEVNKFQSSLG